ncbi:hypothetical protein HMPREF9332_00896 [Alloprevotella rava F0323]|uniref:Uncharacterized protein n=1 Tax=Alloprevotella rava F0323 TaxID=679199 RepID=G5GBE5_9BACT|nr:hypothetical protein HMPREF9332_00896 [Alloprevotella rava F0323]
MQKRVVVTNFFSNFEKKKWETHLFPTDLVFNTCRNGAFFLILSADTIRLSADSLIVFSNFLIVSTGSLIGQVRAVGLF